MRTSSKWASPIFLVLAVRSSLHSAGFKQDGSGQSPQLPSMPLPWLRVAIVPRPCRCCRSRCGHVTDKELQKRIGLDGVRCATYCSSRRPLLDFLRMLSRQFPHDPEVLVRPDSRFLRPVLSRRPGTGHAPLRLRSLLSKWMQTRVKCRANGTKRKRTIAKSWSKTRAILAFTFAWPGFCCPSRIRPRFRRAGKERAAAGTRNRSNQRRC